MPLHANCPSIFLWRQFLSQIFNILGGRHMKVFRSASLVLLSLLFVAFLAACGSDEADSSEPETDDNGETSEEATEGGELNVALNAQPPTMDPQYSTAVATRDVTRDRKSTRLNSSHVAISYAVFC